MSYYTIPRASAVINEPQVIEEDVDFCLTDLEKTNLALPLYLSLSDTAYWRLLSLSLSPRQGLQRDTCLRPDVLLCLPGGSTLFSTCR